jgi:pyridoxine 5-phosphate synthase
MVELAKKLEADRVELYTETYAKKFPINRQNAIKDFYKCSLLAKNINIGLNAGHDLNLDNLKYFSSKIDNLLEVSIGHALISDSIYFGLQNTISMYKRLL